MIPTVSSPSCAAELTTRPPLLWQSEQRSPPMSPCSDRVADSTQWWLRHSIQKLVAICRHTSTPSRVVTRWKQRTPSSPFDASHVGPHAMRLSSVHGTPHPASACACFARCPPRTRELEHSDSERALQPELRDGVSGVVIIAFGQLMFRSVKNTEQAIWDFFPV